MSVTPEAKALVHATFKPLGGVDKNNKPFKVDFNPASLQHTVASTMKPKNPKQQDGDQFVSRTTAKLTMDLVFDTTLTCVDVREKTKKMVNLLSPGKGKMLPKVQFSWGGYFFEGIAEQYKETLEFFSSDGVPLRASINLTLSNSELEFTSSKDPEAAADGEKDPEPFIVPDSVGPSSVANSLGDPRAARAIALLSGSVSLRFGGGASLAVAGDVSLSPPAVFSTGGGLSAGGGAGGGAGLDVAATAGEAFAGLRVGASASGGVTNSQALLPPPSAASGGSAGFDLGGAARASGGGSLSADVCASADLSARIGFSD